MPQLDSFAIDGLSCLPPIILVAIDEAPISELGDGPRVEKLAKLLREGSPDEGWDQISPVARALTMSGLWLLAGDLDRSHTLSQDIPSADGSFWHGIMHRREGDFGNSKYWFRKVGEHPVCDQLCDLSDGDYSDPFDFVDQCSRAKPGSNAYAECQRTQWLEWQALMAYGLGSA